MKFPSQSIAVFLASLPLLSAEEPASLGRLDGSFYRNTAVLDRTLAPGAMMWEIPDWMTKTDFPYQKKPFARELPFADATTVVRLLGGWVEPALPADRRNDDNDLLWRDDGGRLHYRWDLLKARLDPYVAQGYELTLVMDNVPHALADSPQAGDYGQAAPPANWQEWHDFIRAMCAELKRLYGEKTANGFRFRMGTEMQDERRFIGNFEQYLAFYDHAAKAVKAELPGAKFGPFNRAMPKNAMQDFDGYTRGNVSLLGVVKHCAEGKNAATGETGSPIDFVARSLYYFTSIDAKGKLTNVHPDERLPEFKLVWDRARATAPQFATLSREVHEFGPHLQTEGGIYGQDTGARGAAQTLHTLIGLREIGADRVWHWGLFERIVPDKILLMSQGWLYAIFDHMRGGELFSPAVSAAQNHGNTRKALLSVKDDEAILLVANWNVDRTQHTPDSLRVTLPAGWQPKGMLRFDETSSVYDVIRRDLAQAGMLSEKHRAHRGNPATTVAVGGYKSMAADAGAARRFVAKDWDRYLGLMKDSLTLKPFDGTFSENDNSLSFEAATPSVTAIVLRKAKP